MTRILVVDDDKTIRTLLERVAKRAGFEVESAKDGLEAVEMLAASVFDIAIVDLMMPRMSGYELVQHISTMNPRPTVIVATAMMNGDASTLDDSLVRRVIKKPFDIKAVANALVETAMAIAEQKKNSTAPHVVVVKDPETTVDESPPTRTESDSPSREK